MCIVRPLILKCCDRTYVEVTRGGAGCPDAWPLEKCPKELSFIVGPQAKSKWEERWAVCWRCKAIGEGLEGDEYEARRPPIDNAFVIEGLKTNNSEGRQVKAGNDGNCLDCDANKDGLANCESCAGNGSASKGKKKCIEDGPEGPAKKKRRVSSAMTPGGTSKPRRGRPPGASNKKKLAVIKEEGHVNLYPSLVNANTASQQGGFHTDLPEYLYGNNSWTSINQNGDPTLPSFNMNIDEDPYLAQFNTMPAFTSNQASLPPYGTVANYTVNPREMEPSTTAYQDHLHPSIEFNHNGPHVESRLGDVGEGVRSDPNLGSSENQFANYPVGREHNHDGADLSHGYWLPYPEGLPYPPSQDTNNNFAPAVHDTHSGDSQVAPASQMTMNQSTSQQKYLPSPALSEAHIAQYAPQDTSTETLAPVSTSAPVAVTSAIASLPVSRLATPP
ncbi:hypothetical protein NHQ30_008040 [Ciborinia camelliae]|nr:hypothetical protein NHQ30_008040 [Ciborinia camelliae]